MSTIQVRVDDELKNKADSLFKALGTDTTSAIRMFLTQAIANNGFPFEIKQPTYILTEDELLKKLENCRLNQEKGLVRNADDVINDIRTKYGL